MPLHENQDYILIVYLAGRVGAQYMHKKMNVEGMNGEYLYVIKSISYALLQYCYASAYYAMLVYITV